MFYPLPREIHHLWKAYSLAGTVLMALGQNTLLSFPKFLVFIVLQLHLNTPNW